MAVTPQMFAHALDHLKGWWDLHALDFDAKLSASVTPDPVYGGSVVHVDTNGEFALGAISFQMPIFLIQGSNSFDVSNPGGNDWTAASPTGKMSGLVATGGYELETTEFYQTTGLTYAPNVPLHAPVEAEITGTDFSLAGNLFKAASWPGGDASATSLTQNICAIVSRANHNNHHRVPVLSFWPVWHPGTSTT